MTPNLLTETATLAENRIAAERSTKPARPQVPELKTVFYEFIPPNARIDRPTTGDSSVGNGGSAWTGSLQTPSMSGNGATFSGSGDSYNGEDWLGSRDRSQLVRKFGLSRRELSYEEPDTEGESGTSPENGGASVETDPTSTGTIGSLSTPSDLFGSNPESTNAQLLQGLQGTPAREEPFLTAAQVAMESENGTLWMPEVVDCRFRYFDGERWFRSWDSIARRGLPVAIKVDLKLIPLDDVEELRNSDYIFQLTYSGTTGGNVLRDGGSHVVGSLGRRTDRPDGGNRKYSIDEVTELLGLSAVMNRSLVTYIPTTPLDRHQIQGRRKPIESAAGRVGNSRSGGSGSRRVESGGSEAGSLIGREATERSATSREAMERTAGERDAESRISDQRVGTSRETRERFGTGREGTGREFLDREATERTARDRSAALDPRQTGPVAAGDWTVLPEKVQTDTFGGIDSLLGGFESPWERKDDFSTPTDPGVVPQIGGIAVPTQTTKSADGRGQQRGTQQTWIRGKR